MAPLSYDPIARMRAVVRAHPTITVHQLARELGYSEDRSIYYWLRKAGFKGLRDFKASVLTSAKQGRETISRHTDVHELAPHTYEGAMYVVETNEFSPWLLPGDRLILDPKRKPGDGSLVLVNSPEGSPHLRLYIQGSPILLLHPANPRNIIRLDPDQSTLTCVCVARLIRELP